MTARETTLGALTAADLGKRVWVRGETTVPTWIEHAALLGAPHTILTDGDNNRLRYPSTTPVTVYDEEEA